MSERETGHGRELEERTKALFDSSVGALDAATRSRLTQARVRALEELSGRRSSVWRTAWIPAGATAAAALAAWLVILELSSTTEPLQADTLDDLEILLGEEDFEMIEELEFYAWLEEQPEFDSNAPAPTGDGVG